MSEVAETLIDPTLSWATAGLKVVTVESWSSFGDALGGELGELRSKDFVFRGISSSTFELESSFDRTFGHLSPGSRERRAKQLTSIFESLIARNKIILNGDSNHHIAAAQHYGLMTRMLDWSTSRYVAAFFAFASLSRDFRSSLDVETDGEDRCVAVYALDTKSPLWSSETIEVNSVEYRNASKRLRRQRGCFTMNHTVHKSIEEFIRKYVLDNPGELDRCPIVRFDLPATEARTALRDLHDMRISHSELFPGLDGIAKEAMLTEWLNMPAI